jgi:hypothetical protein
VNLAGRWAEVCGADSRLLLIVNSQPARLDEIDQVIATITAHCDLSRVFAIAPASLRSELIQRGLSASHVLPARLHGVDVELGFFLESPRAIRWAAERNPTLVLGSEPYAPNNEEVKDAFELRAAALLGAASFVAHSLPDDRVFCFDIKELWLRTARHEAIARHHARVQSGIGMLERAWKAGAPFDAGLIGGEMVGQDLDPNQPVIVDASKHTCDRLSRALSESGGGGDGGARLHVNPMGRWPLATALPATVEPVTRPADVAAGVLWHRTRLAMRGVAVAPYSSLLLSRPTKLAAGDAAVAEGTVYRGGVTIGLQVNNQWVSQVDIDDPGPFIAVAVTPVGGLHSLIIANCLRGEDLRNAFALHRFGWARRAR